MIDIDELLRDDARSWNSCRPNLELRTPSGRASHRVTRRRMVLAAGAAAVLVAALAVLWSLRDDAGIPSVQRSAAAGAPSHSAQRDPSLPQVTYSGPISAGRSYIDSSIVLAVPADGDTPTTTWQQAFLNCVHGAACSSASATRASLALVTTPRGPGHSRRDGSVAPLADRRLSYVFVWNDRCAPAGGPPPAPGSSAAPPTIATCLNVAVVDARSGKELFSADAAQP